jgi:hypothetical protein
MAGTGPAMTKRVFMWRYLALPKPFLQYLARDGVRCRQGKTIGPITTIEEATL